MLLEQLRAQSKIITSRSSTVPEKIDARREVYRLLKEAGMQDTDKKLVLETGEKINLPGISTLGDYRGFRLQFKSSGTYKINVDYKETIYI